MRGRLQQGEGLLWVSGGLAVNIDSAGSGERMKKQPYLQHVPQARTRARTLTSTVADRLRTLIIDGTIPPGSPLRLNALADRLDVSITPVREAIRVLEAERLVITSPHRGATVLRISSDEVEEIYAMRVGLEHLAARRAMERILPNEVLALRDQFEVMATAARREDLDRFSSEDRRFHQMLYVCAGRPPLLTKILGLTQSSFRATKLAYGIWRPLMLGLDAHRPLMEAIEAGDPDRVARMTYEHVREGGSRIHAAVLRWEEAQNEGSDDVAALVNEAPSPVSRDGISR